MDLDDTHSLYKMCFSHKVKGRVFVGHVKIFIKFYFFICLISYILFHYVILYISLYALFHIFISFHIFSSMQMSVLDPALKAGPYEFRPVCCPMCFSCEKLVPIKDYFQWGSLFSHLVCNSCFKSCCLAFYKLVSSQGLDRGI